MNEAKMREEFEAWAAEHSTMAQYLDRTVSGLYASSVTENFWSCWKASREAVASEAERKSAQVKSEVEALRLFMHARYPVSMQIDVRGYRWSEPYLDQAYSAVRGAISKEAGQ